MSSSIQQEVERWMRVYENNKATESLQGSIYGVLDQFHDFINQFIGFLDKETSKLSDTFPEDWLAFSIEAVLVEYWEPIKRVAQQYATEKYFLETFTDGYKYEENLLDIGYQRLVEYNKNSPIQIKQNMLIYFDKIEKAIRFPFGPVLLVGIPYQDAKRNDWSAIPHEIGHHLYWNLYFTFDKQSFVPYRDDPAVFGNIIDKVSSADGNVKSTLKMWSEEVFAETVGALIGKDDHLESAFTKVLARIGVKKELFYHDNDHPAPYFIPFISAFAWGEKLDDAIDALQRRYGVNRFNKLDDAMDALWERYGKDRFKKMNEITDDSKEPQKVDTELVKEGLQGLVKKIVSFFTAEASVSQPAPSPSMQSVLPLTKEISKQSVSPLVEENSEAGFSIDKLVMWIEKERNISNREELIKALLIPRILEGHKWRCRFCGKTNENDQAQSCAFCGRKR